MSIYIAEEILHLTTEEHINVHIYTDGSKMDDNRVGIVAGFSSPSLNKGPPGVVSIFIAIEELENSLPGNYAIFSDFQSVLQTSYWMLVIILW